MEAGAAWVLSKALISSPFNRERLKALLFSAVLDGPADDQYRAQGEEGRRYDGRGESRRGSIPVSSEDFVKHVNHGQED